MSSDPSEQAANQRLEQDLETLGSRWQSLGRVEPPELVDQAVLNAARRALEERRSRKPLGWLGGAIATAAVVVLALFIVIQQDQQGPVPPASKTDGLRLDQRATEPARTASDQHSPLEKAGHADLLMKQKATAAPITASKTLPLPEMQEEPPAREVFEEDAVSPKPEAWIRRMIRLRQAGRTEELEAEMAAFRRAFPDYPLPPELLD